jgi:hypothetical protein
MDSPHKRLRVAAGIGGLGALFDSDHKVAVRVADLKAVLDDLTRLHELVGCATSDGTGKQTVLCPECGGSGTILPPRETNDVRP